MPPSKMQRSKKAPTTQRKDKHLATTEARIQGFADALLVFGLGLGLGLATKFLPPACSRCGRDLHQGDCLPKELVKTS